jgi:hypothetical protein
MTPTIRRLWAASSLLAVLGFASHPCRAGDLLPPPLKVGQSVNVETVGSGIVISAWTGPAIGTYRILAIGTNAISLEDMVHVTQLWIPFTAITKVEWTRLPNTSP